MVGVPEPQKAVEPAAVPPTAPAQVGTLNSSAPMSGVVALRVVASISMVTVPIGVPKSFKLTLLPGIKCKSEFVVKVGKILTEFAFCPKPAMIPARLVLSVAPILPRIAEPELKELTT